jgi:hypothetical protein
VREGGQPLAGATVSLSVGDGPDLPFGPGGLRARTDGDGRFVLERVEVGELRLSVTHPARAMPYSAEVSVRPGENTLDLDLPLSIVEGVVRGEDGQPLAGLRVRAERAGGESVVRSFAFVMNDGEGAVSFGAASGEGATTDAEGRYRLRGVQDGVELAVVASGKDVREARSAPFEVGPGELRSGVDLVARRGSTLEVRCRRPGGAPAFPCEVRAELVGDEGSDEQLEISDPQGLARFQGLKPGRWKVSARDLARGPGASTPAVEQVVDLAPGGPHAVTLEVPGS